ncbi:chemotaxis protein CheW [Curvibacter sp. CHRR-16]|uniref:chemotaxis protein CheW n=1 Tax=Curvibacter sp. CHRR-16 TaxID=2835872 RepID=UPI001BDA8A8E|nr:chemotaxis protein CheW [Curvibacter sp. CHRR-16]MBT0568772.1 chemotaxis protein CheW [Curvibacter sp. CHRR-16]
MEQVADAALNATVDNLNQYLAFKLGTEEYVIDILQVQEIRSYEQPTKMANSPSYIKGVINLRGVIVPIVDLRLKLNQAQVEYNDFTVVIILKVRSTVVGVVVDGVSDVVNIAPNTIQPAPQFNAGIEARFIRGIAHQGQRALIVMDMNALMSNAELGLAAVG